MKLALPSFQYRFMAAAGNVIFPGNFHPVGTQRAAELDVAKCLAEAPSTSGEAPLWLVVGGSGGFGSAARIALATDQGASTVNVSFDAQPQPASNNKIRKIGSPGFHRNLAIERALRGAGRKAHSYNMDAFDPEARANLVKAIKDQFAGQRIAGVVWSLAAPRGLDPRTGKPVSSALKPLGKTATVKSFGAAQEDEGPEISHLEIAPGSPEEAIRTQYVMGGGIVETWVNTLKHADLLAEGFTLLTISYRGNPLNEAIYRKGLIGLAKADLEFTTAALNVQLDRELGGRAISVEGPAVVTEASGGIPGVPLYMALVRDVMGSNFEDPLPNMRRLFREHIAVGKTPELDDEGLLRMDDRELAEEVQAPLAERFNKLQPGDRLERRLFDDFMAAYSRTRGFGVEGVDYEAEFDTDEICQA